MPSPLIPPTPLKQHQHTIQFMIFFIATQNSLERVFQTIVISFKAKITFAEIMVTLENPEIYHKAAKKLGKNLQIPVTLKIRSGEIETQNMTFGSQLRRNILWDKADSLRSSLVEYTRAKPTKKSGNAL
jgi:hypothetical protein